MVDEIVLFSTLSLGAPFLSGVDRLLLVHLPDRRGLVSEGMRAVERWVGVTYASQGSLAYWSGALPLYDIGGSSAIPHILPRRAYV